MIVGGLKKTVSASAPDPVNFASIEDVISGKIPLIVSVNHAHELCANSTY